MFSFILFGSGSIPVEYIWLSVDESDLRLPCEYMQETYLLASSLSQIIC